MKGNFLRNIRRKRRVVSVVASALVLVAIGTTLLLWRDTLASILLRAVEPVLVVRNALDASESSRLRAELARMKAEAADRAVLLQENLELKRRLAREVASDTVLAAVLQRSPTTPYDTLLIDIGASDGIWEGDLVAAGGNALIGRVVNVYGASSRVVLFSSPDETHEALLQRGATVVPITLEGQGAGALEARAPVGTNARIGDVALLPGIAGGMTASVVGVSKPEGAAFETLYFHLSANPNELRLVDVWRGTSPSGL